MILSMWFYEVNLTTDNKTGKSVSEEGSKMLYFFMLRRGEGRGEARERKSKLKEM